MRRFRLVAALVSGQPPDQWRWPDLPEGTNYVTCADLGTHFLVVCNPPDDAPVTTDTLAELNASGQIAAASLSVAQRGTVKTWLTKQGFDISQFDGDAVTNRAKLLSFVLRRLAHRPDLDGPAILRLGVWES